MGGVPWNSQEQKIMGGGGQTGNEPSVGGIDIF